MNLCTHCNKASVPMTGGICPTCLAKASHKEAKRLWAERNRKKKAENGLVQISGFVHSAQAPELRKVIQMLQENPDLALTVLRDERTGQFVKV